MADHAEACRHELQLFGHIAAELAQTAAAGRAGIGWRCIDLLVARQVIRQGAAHRLLARCLVGGRHLAPRFAFFGLQVFELQFQLLDLMVKFLGFAAELHAPQLGDLQLGGHDLDGARVQLLTQTDDHRILGKQ